MKIQRQYNFYDLSAIKRGLSIEILNDEYTIISTCSLQYIDNSIEDIDKLYEIATKDKELNNPNNLITVCSICHHKIHGKVGGL